MMHWCGEGFGPGGSCDTVRTATPGTQGDRPRVRFRAPKITTKTNRKIAQGDRPRVLQGDRPRVRFCAPKITTKNESKNRTGGQAPCVNTAKIAISWLPLLLKFQLTLRHG